MSEFEFSLPYAEGNITLPQIESSYIEQAKLTQITRLIWVSCLSEVPVSSIDGLFDGKVRLQDGENQAVLDYAQLIGWLGAQKDGIKVDQGEFKNNGDVCFNCLRTNGGSQSEIMQIGFATDSPLLPAINKIEFSPATTKSTELGPIECRLLSVNHRWHTLVEAPEKHSAPFKEIIGDGFKMEFGHGSVNSFEELHNWVHGSASTMKLARHDMERFSWQEVAPNQYRAVFDLQWNGVNLEDQRMLATTRHTWQIDNSDPRARFPRIKHMQVEFITPFTEVS